MSTYKDLPFFLVVDCPSLVYGKAAAMRTPVRDAINSARDMPDSKMDEVILVLELALAHIRQGQANEEVDVVADSDDPLDSLLGPAETKSDASKRRSKSRR